MTGLSTLGARGIHARGLDGSVPAAQPARLKCERGWAGCIRPVGPRAVAEQPRISRPWINNMTDHDR
jgi:hypothetical protein